MGFRPHYLLDLIIGAIAAGAIGFLAWRARTLPPRRRALLVSALAAILAIIALYVAFGTVRISRLFPGPIVAWVRCLGLFAAVGIAWATLLFLARRTVRTEDPGRRRALQFATAAAIAAPAALATFGILRRNDLQFREVDIRLPNLPPDLDGLRLIQLSDIHLSIFVPEAVLERAVGMANETRPHLALVTGDLITSNGDPLDACLRGLSRLRADAGVFGCCGNHEIYAGAEDYVERNGGRLGMRFLRNESQSLIFGGSVLNLAGVDYQRRGRTYLEGAESLRIPGAVNVLLSHNPDVFPTAAAQGYDLTISGHTHGGQVQFEMIHPALNIVRFTTPYVYGPYQKDGRSLYVTRGIGTIGVPVRLGALPEVVCLRLCAT